MKILTIVILRGQDDSKADSSGAFSNDFLAYPDIFQRPSFSGHSGAYGSYHIGPEADLRGPNEMPLIVPLDSDLFHGTVYEKYNNGRFFLNSELAWLYWTDRFGADPKNRNGPMPAPLKPRTARTTSRFSVATANPIHSTVTGSHRNRNPGWTSQDQFPQSLVPGTGQTQRNVYRSTARSLCQASDL